MDTLRLRYDQFTQHKYRGFTEPNSSTIEIIRHCSRVRVIAKGRLHGRKRTLDDGLTFSTDGAVVTSVEVKRRPINDASITCRV